ncbi:Mg2+ transporter [Madurella fahalii]|uniref:Mg2+ transporter n=1 Tax=Madurella fahalii TaxID=1157608 RepID=A0ABQ0GJF0_9PEZI
MGMSNVSVAPTHINNSFYDAPPPHRTVIPEFPSPGRNRVPFSSRSRSRSRSRFRSRTPPAVIIENRVSEFSSDDDVESAARYRRRNRVLRVDAVAGDVDETTSSTVYSFTPSRTSRAVSSYGSRAAEDELSGKEEDKTALPRDGHRLPRLWHIFESQYYGDYMQDGSHGAKLTAVLSAETKYQPLFRWLHCTRQFMDFDDFSNEATRLPNLSLAEQKGIRDLLAGVKQKFVKAVPTSTGQNVRHMEPACIQRVLPFDGTLKNQSFTRRTVTWICLPYFTLEKYSGLLGAGGNTSAFPVETLLQAKFSRATRERDMQQVVCQNKNTPPGLCFHVAQIWCLVVDNALLFTYCQMAEDVLRGESIRMSVKSPQELSNFGSKALITVSFKNSVMWSLPVDECQTWLGFLSHFRDFWPRRLLFFRRKRAVTAEDWPRIWNTAKHVSAKIMLEMRFGLEPPASWMKSNTNGQASHAPELPPTGLLITTDKGKGASEDAASKSDHVSQPQPESTKRATAETSGRLRPDRNGKTAPVKPKSTTQSAGGMSIFSWLVGVTRPDSDEIDLDALEDHLQEVEDFLLYETSFRDRRAYRDCPDGTREDLVSLLEQKGADLSESTEAQHRRQKDFEMQLDLFNAADLVFKFFFPANVVVPTVHKFWGALKVIIIDGDLDAEYGEMSLGGLARPRIQKSAMRHLRSELQRLCVRMQTFSEIFSRLQRQDRVKLAVPKELVQGWIHLLMSVIYLPRDRDKTEQLIDDGKTLIKNGMSAVVQSLSEQPLLDHSVVMPLELVSMISLRLLQDITLGMPDMYDCYSSHLDALESEVYTKPPDRSRENRINLVLEEVAAALRIIGDQVEIFNSLMFLAQTDQRAGPDTPRFTEYVDGGVLRRRSPRDFSSYSYSRTRHSNPRHRNDTRSYSREDPYNDYDDEEEADYVAAESTSDLKLEPTDTDGYRILLLSECARFLSGRRNGFTELHGWATTLARANRDRVDTTKDRQDRAIYAFTIVTVVFLPISAVASIFGMNTSDIRDMELGQWAYWAAAVPVTTIVVFLGLLWTGELGSIVQWIQSFGVHRQGYRSIPDDGYYVTHAGRSPWEAARVPLPHFLREENRRPEPGRLVITQREV